MSQESKHVIERAYKTRVYMNKYQEHFFHQHAGNRRYIYNQLLALLQDRWDEKKIIVKRFGKKRKPLEVPTEQEVKVRSKTYLQLMLTELANKEENSFLKKTNSQSNQEASHALANAISNWKNPKMKGFGKPTFKKKTFFKVFLFAI